jgi:hypothetical protein
MKKQKWAGPFWTTECELEFLKKIGTYRKDRPPSSRKELLVKYKESIPGRKDWGKIHKEIVVDYVNFEIMKDKK